MKNSKLIVCTGIVLLLAGVTLNVKDALNAHGIVTISLHPSIAAQTDGNNGITTGTGKQESSTIQCETSTTSTTSSSEAETTSSGKSWGVGGSVGGNAGWGSANVSGQGGKSSGKSTSTSSGSSESTTTKRTWSGTKYWCSDPKVEESCFNQDPCKL